MYQLRQAIWRHIWKYTEKKMKEMKPLKVSVPPLKLWFNIMWKICLLHSFAQLYAVELIYISLSLIRCASISKTCIAQSVTDWLTKRFQITNITSESISENELGLFPFFSQAVIGTCTVHPGDHMTCWHFRDFSSQSRKRSRAAWLHLPTFRQDKNNFLLDRYVYVQPLETRTVRTTNPPQDQVVNLKLATGMKWLRHQTYTSHHYDYQWWEYADDKNPPHLLMTYSHHGGILSWWEYAVKPWWWWW